MTIDVKCLFNKFQVYRQALQRSCNLTLQRKKQKQYQLFQGTLKKSNKHRNFPSSVVV